LPLSRGLTWAVIALLLPPLAIEMAHATRARKIGTPKHSPAPTAKARVKPAPVVCDPAKFRLIVDVGHTSESPGADSARNDVEFGFNLQLAKLLAARLKAEGFAATRLLVTEGKARASLFKRVVAANDVRADLFLSIHHDSVPDKLLEEWEFDGAKSHFSDRFSGYSLFVSKSNPHFGSSLAFARLIGRQMKAGGLHYATQYTMPIMGRYRRDLLDKDVGVYRYDGLVVLSRTRSPAVLLEAGSIINRDEEMEMNSPERRETIVAAVAAAMKQFCSRK
jgi:N-acetylmuramoyl-L-alanine amidase